MKGRHRHRAERFLTSEGATSELLATANRKVLQLFSSCLPEFVSRNRIRQRLLGRLTPVDHEPLTYAAAADRVY